MTEQTTDGDVKRLKVSDAAEVRAYLLGTRDLTIEADRANDAAVAAFGRLTDRLSEQEAELERAAGVEKAARNVLTTWGLPPDAGSLFGQALSELRDALEDR